MPSPENRAMKEESMDVLESLRSLGPFGLLCHVHDHIWRDKSWPLTVRLGAFHEVWALKKHVRRRTLAAVIFIFCLFPHGVSAQTVAPVIVELSARGNKSFSGSFTVNNPGITPITAVIEVPQSMVFTNGKPTLKSLEPGVTLDLSQQSAKVGARQSAQFWYTLKCAAKPCAVMLFTTISGPHAANGMSVAIHLPHVIYACEKQKNCRKTVISGGKP
jgi:hypothetical protein